MTVFVILLIFLLLFLLWPRIIAWLRPHIQAWMLRRIEKHIRRAAGIPDEEPRGHRRSRKTDAGNNTDNGYSRHAPQQSGPIIPREYAEDVEYTETIDYSSDTTVAPDGSRHEHPVLLYRTLYVYMLPILIQNLIDPEFPFLFFFFRMKPSCNNRIEIHRLSRITFLRKACYRIYL